jgi:hypothetical protein
MKNLILILLFACATLSCKDSSKRIMNLENENKRLKETIKDLNANIEKSKLMPIFYPKESNINLGETYEAAFFIGTYNNERPPFITVFNQETPNNVDTLVYDENLRGNYFCYKPKSKGHYVFFANMKIAKTLNDTLSFPMKWEFDVK